MKKRERSQELGATMIEYALVVALISIVVLVVMSALGEKAGNNFDLVSDNLDSAASPLSPQD